MTEKEQAQVKMFGTTVESLKRDYNNAGLDQRMYLMGLLSDVQEAMARGQLEQARQWTNKAKYIVMNIDRDAFKNIE